MSPQTIGRYEVQGLLGEGAFGQVFAARDPMLGRVVAIKILREQYSRDASFMARFNAEAASLAALVHPNITLLYDMLESGQQRGMVMELVHGHTLEHVLERTNRLGLRETLAVLAQAVAGLGYIHRMGVVHRDIKPSNMMLTDSGLLKIMDFGIARVRGAKRLTQEGSIVGTLAYMAPEQIRSGEGEPRSDLYSLACMAYEMLSGNPPFEAATEYNLMQAHMHAPPDPLSNRVAGLPDVVEQALKRALAKDPAERFATVEEFGRAIGTDAVQLQAVDIVRDNIVRRVGPIPPAPTRIMTAPPTGATRNETGPSSVGAGDGRRSASMRSKMPIVVLGGAALLAAAVAGFIVLGGDTTPPVPPSQASATAAQIASSPPSVGALSGGAATATGNPAVSLPIVGEAAKTVPGADLAPGSKPAVVEPVPPASVAVRHADLPPSSFQIPSDSPARPSVAPVSAPVAGPVPGPEVRTAIAPQLAVPTPLLLPPAGSAIPDGPPFFAGQILDWPRGDTIVVHGEKGSGPRFLRLFGLVTNTGTPNQADDDHHKRLVFLHDVGGQVTCFKHDSVDQNVLRVQCFADKQDIALWAVGNHLARSSPDAPESYREVRQ